VTSAISVAAIGRRCDGGIRDGLAERLGKPLGGHRAVAPLVRSGALEAELHWNVAKRHLGEFGGDGARIERAENRGAVEVVVFVDPDAVEPRTWSELAVDAKAARLSMRLAARNADAHVVTGICFEPWSSFDRSRSHRSCRSLW
jgi:hypothetical protein